MRFLGMVLVIIFSVGIGWILDKKFGFQVPPIYWLLGFLTGLLANVIAG